MSYSTLNSVVARACTDAEFAADLLNGRRSACLEQFDFTEPELLRLQAIQADSLDQFIRAANSALADGDPWSRLDDLRASGEPAPVAEPTPLDDELAHQLFAIVGRSVVDADFREQLLNGQRATIFDNVALAQHDRARVLGVEDHNYPQFVAEVEKIVPVAVE